MRNVLTAFIIALITATALVTAQAPATSSTPFKLGTFEHQGRRFLGLVLRDSAVVELVAANAALEKAKPSAPKVAIPSTMQDMITRHSTLRARLAEIAGAAAAAGGAAYIHDVKTVKTLPPLMPGTIFNVAVNYQEHADEMAGRPAAATAAPAAPAKVPASIPGIWERKSGDTRQNPYVFLKSRNAVVGNGEAIRVPPGRDSVDWECELTVVIGRQATRVPVERAKEYIFGYTLENDVSDRAGRGDGRHGSDWFIGKSHDTFAPMGPYIVPTEFIADPQKLSTKFTLSGKLMQDSTTNLMIHDVFELVHYVSNIITMMPGDVIATGSPAGVGSARKPPIFMKPGDVSVCQIEGIGTLSNPVVAGTATMSDGRR